MARLGWSQQRLSLHHGRLLRRKTSVRLTNQRGSFSWESGAAVVPACIHQVCNHPWEMLQLVTTLGQRNVGTLFTQIRFC